MGFPQSSLNLYSMARILITGGTGFVGGRLSGLLAQRGHQVTVLTRDRSMLERRSNDRAGYAYWDPEKLDIDRRALENAEVIINLAGANIQEKRWSADRKRTIKESRVRSCQALCNFLEGSPNQVTTIVSASAIGIYGDAPLGAPSFVENDPPAHDFLGSTCHEWEAAIAPAATAMRRLAIIRTGIALGRDGGAWKELARTARWGLAPYMGSGRQMVSWIHLDDLCGMYAHAVENKEMNGPYNGVAPWPVSNKELSVAMAKAFRGRALALPVPGPLLRIALGEMAGELLKNAPVSAQKVIGAGFTFRYPALQAAAAHIVAGTGPKGN